MPTEEKHLQGIIYESRDEKLVSPKTGKSIVRIARFLNPCTKHVNKAIPIPNSPMLSDIFPHSLQQWPSKVLFKGWKYPQKNWKQWVNRLSPKFGSIWKKTGIYNSIMSSTYEIRSNQDLVLGLSEFWCSDTSTFVFPWGEATITLEDIVILGGYSVFGKPLNSPLTREMVKVEEFLKKQRMAFSRTKSRKAGHGGWLKHFMENQGEFEHVAFLSLWLSMYVFSSPPEKAIGNCVFAIATLLSHGTPVALGPAVLASLYKDLRFLKEQAMACSQSINVFGPFQLVQLWVFERFPLLGPNAPNQLEPGEPRAARWHKLNSRTNIPLVKSALRLPENFQWRPYGRNLKNWQHSMYCKEADRSFVQCLQGCELAGIGCREKYRPHRVAMQFGFDQDLPAAAPSGTAEQASFFSVPSRSSFEPCVSARYLKWWTNSMFARKAAIKDAVLVHKRKLFMSSKTSLPPAPEQNKDCHGSFAPKSINSWPRYKTKTKTQIIREWRDEADLSSSSVVGARATKSKDLPNVSKKLIYDESSDDDHLFTRKINQNCRERTTKRNLPNKTTIHCVNDIAKEEQGKVSRASDDPKVVASKLKRKAGFSVSDYAFSNKMSKRNKISAKCVAKQGEEEKGGGSFDNPINVDGYKLGLQLEERVQKIEKILGVIPD